MKADAIVDACGGWSSEQYQLIDFGGGRKLERFGALLLDRVCPAAERFQVSNADRWQAADIVLDAKGKLLRQRRGPSDLPSQWAVEFRDLQFLLKLTPFGHVGLFPEQAANWSWLRALAEDSTKASQASTALNLFAYTGGTSLVLAQAGFQVVHVDASAPAVAWARENASASGLVSAPIRWIVEDARKFVARELRRGRAYDVIVLDPPSFGHGPRGQRWEIATELPDLLDACVALLKVERNGTLLLTAHCSQPSQSALYREVARRISGRLQSGELVLKDLAGRDLNAGFYIRAVAC